MVVAYPDLPWVLDTVAHEWTHTYLYLRPLGWHYGGSGGMRTINETVASIVGDEIGRRVVKNATTRADAADRVAAPLSMRSDWLGKDSAPPQFEYGPFMRKTRLKPISCRLKAKSTRPKNTWSPNAASWWKTATPSAS